MFAFFRINDPYRLIGLFIILLVVTLPLFIKPVPPSIPELKTIAVGFKVQEGFNLYQNLITDTPPLAAWFDRVFYVITGDSVILRRIIAFFLLFLFSGFSGIMFINRKSFPENTYLPSLIFSLLVLLSPYTLSLTGYLIGFGFVLLGLNKLFREIEFGNRSDENVFAIGLFVGISSLLDFSFIIYLPGSTVVLLLFTRIPVRKHLLMVTGGLLPHFLLISWHFAFGDLPEFWRYFYQANLNAFGQNYVDLRSFLYMGAVPLFFLLLSVFVLNREARLTKYQSQLLQVMFIWMIIALVQIVMIKKNHPQVLITLIPSFTFYITYLLLVIRRKRFAEAYLWLLLTGMVATCYLSRYELIERIDISGLIPGQPAPVSGKRVLLLGDQPAIFLQNVPATGFIDWELSRQFFEHPKSYTNVGYVYSQLTQDTPEVIIDPQNLMDPIFERMPDLKARYRKTALGFERADPSN